MRLETLDKVNQFPKQNFDPSIITDYRCRARALRDEGGDLMPTSGFERHNHPGNPKYGQFLVKRRELIDIMLKQKEESLTRIFKNFVRE